MFSDRAGLGKSVRYHRSGAIDGCADSVWDSCVFRPNDLCYIFGASVFCESRWYGIDLESVAKWNCVRLSALSILIHDSYDMIDLGSL